MASVQDVYSSLWAHAESFGVVVCYDAFNNHMAGWFHPNASSVRKRELAEPQLRLYRKGRGSRRPNFETDEASLRGELYTLAHECGHLMSWHESYETDETWAVQRAYRAAAVHFENVEKAQRALPGATDLSPIEFTRRIARAMKDELTAEEHRLILEEEQGAWRVGHGLLGEFGLADFAEFDARVASSLRNYHVRLGMVPIDETHSQTEA